MFSKVIAIIALGAISATAISTANVNGIDYSCNTGPVTCCNSYQKAGTFTAADVYSLVGVAVSNVSGQLGTQCSPLTGIGAATGANCSAEPVCCEQNFQNQLVGVNCSPATVGL